MRRRSHPSPGGVTRRAQPLHEHCPRGGLNVTELAFLAAERALINRPTREVIEGIAVMHTMAVLDDGGRKLQEHQAREYIGLAEGLLLALRLPLQRGG